MNSIITNIQRAPRAVGVPPVPGRSIHLIDIENLCGASQPTLGQVRLARQRYMDTGLLSQGDHIVIASSRGNYLNSACGWPGARYLARDGKDGADICLAKVMLEERLESRFTRVIVASGDGGLAPFVSNLAAMGVDTVAVSKSDCLSREMRLAAHRSIVLTPDIEDIA